MCRICCWLSRDVTIGHFPDVCLLVVFTCPLTFISLTSIFVCMIYFICGFTCGTSHSLPIISLSSIMDKYYSGTYLGI